MISIFAVYKFPTCLRVLDIHFGGPRPCLHVSPLLQRENKAAVAYNWTLGQAVQDALFRITSLQQPNTISNQLSCHFIDLMNIFYSSPSM